jgi:hypothetical protein
VTGHKPRKPAAPSRRRRPWLIFAGLAVAMAAAGLYFVFRPDPERNLLDLLRERHYELNEGFVAHYRPGTVIRLFRRGPNGQTEALPRPDVAFWPEQCFPGRQPRAEAFVLPRSSGKRALHLSAERLHKLLPGFGIQGAKHWEVEILRPRSLAFALLGDLSEQFSEECLNGLEKRHDAGEPLAWYRTITQAVVADGLRIAIDWQAGANAEVREAARRTIKESLASVPAIDAKFTSEEQSVLDVKGDLVLAYLTDAMDPVTEQGKTQSGGGR